ncbi:hypothetical protein KR018_002365, partial [Drosophila ironensis]
VTQSLPCRKRSREDDLNCESAPLSKRINSLHLAYEDSSSSSSCSIPPLYSGDVNSGSSGCSGSAGPPGPPGPAGGAAAAAGPATAAAEPVYEYNPELGADQNPYYYEKNRMLYDLHAERMKRSLH